MSQHEVNTPQDIRESVYVRLHIYASRTTQAMKKFEDLTFYCVPPLSPGRYTTLASFNLFLDVRCELNIWAGQLYLDKYGTYLFLCLLLGVFSNGKAGSIPQFSDQLFHRY